MASESTRHGKISLKMCVCVSHSLDFCEARIMMRFFRNGRALCKSVNMFILLVSSGECGFWLFLREINI